ncbi:hypothetical protein FQZ97_1029930 [compost metagenome]
MEQHTARTGQLTDGGDVVDGADFVVYMHDRHQNGVLAQRRLDHGRRDQAVFARFDIGHFEAFALQLAGGIQYRLVLDLRGHDVLALATVEVGNAFDRQVVRLGGTGRPDDLARVSIDQLGNLTTTVLDSLLGLPAKHMGARCRIAEVTIDQQTLTHFLRHSRIDRSGGGIIEVNRQFH